MSPTSLFYFTNKAKPFVEEWTIKCKPFDNTSVFLIISFRKTVKVLFLNWLEKMCKRFSSTDLKFTTNTRNIQKFINYNLFAFEKYKKMRIECVLAYLHVQSAKKLKSKKLI